MKTYRIQIPLNNNSEQFTQRRTTTDLLCLFFSLRRNSTSTGFSEFLSERGGKRWRSSGTGTKGSGNGNESFLLLTDNFNYFPPSHNTCTISSLVSCSELSVKIHNIESFNINFFVSSFCLCFLCVNLTLSVLFLSALIKCTLNNLMQGIINCHLPN